MDNDKYLKAHQRMARGGDPLSGGDFGVEKLSSMAASPAVRKDADKKDTRPEKGYK